MNMKAETFIENNVVENGGFNQLEVVVKNDALEAVKIAHNDAVKKWSLWCFNYHTPFERTICEIWGGKLSGFGGRYYCENNHLTQHLIEKWQSFENRGDARMLFFYCELDSGLREQLVNWVMEHYAG